MSIHKKIQEYSSLFPMSNKLGRKFIFPVFFIMVALTSPVQAAPHAVTVVDTLYLGLLAPGTNGGTVSFPANGSINQTGDVLLLGGEQKGRVTIQATQGKKIRVLVKKIRLTGPPRNKSMRLVGNCIGPGGVLGIHKCSFIATGGIDVVYIGADLRVGPNRKQTGGHYSGLVKVTAQSK